jgi:RNA polymerase-binding transcription factor DksA
VSEIQNSPDASSPPTATSDEVLADANALLGEIERELAAIDRALNRLDAHGYGTCAVCGLVIEDQVLAADPTEEHCLEHRTGARRLFPG